MRKKLKGFSIAEVTISIMLVGLLAMATMPILTQMSQFERGINQNAIDCINNNTIVENGLGVITMPTSGACQTAVLDCQYDKGKAFNTINYYATSGTGAQRLSSEKILRTACDQGGAKACDYFINKCINIGVCDDSTNFYDINYYLKLPATTLSKAIDYLFPALTRFFNDFQATIRTFVNNSCTAVPGSVACLIKSPATLIKNCNNHVDASCTDAYNYNFNRSCLQIKTVWPGAPDGEYRLTHSATGFFPTNCDMTNDGGGWTQVAANDGSVVFTPTTYSMGYGLLPSDRNFIYDPAYWFDSYANPTMRIKMSAITDFYRPATGQTLSAMVGSYSKHKWASNFNDPFVIPNYYTYHQGGSSTLWPVYNVPNENRSYISFWAGNVGPAGGCCHSTNDGVGAWNQPFTMWVRESAVAQPKGSDCNATQLLFTTPTSAPAGQYEMTSGANQFCSMSKHHSCLDWYNAGYTADGTYWVNPSGTSGQQFATKCDMTTDGGGWTQVAATDGTINLSDAQYAGGVGTSPANSTYIIPASLFDTYNTPVIRIKMGSWIDYYRPDSGNLSTLITANNYKVNISRRWANNFNNPFIIVPYYGGHLGGSTGVWPAATISGDGRSFTSFWGAGIEDGRKGGCCFGTADWFNQPFTMWVKEGITDKKAADCNTLQNSFVTPASAPSGLYVMSDNSKAYCGMNFRRSCNDWKTWDNTLSPHIPLPNGIYTINPTQTTGAQFPAYCDMTTDGGGWTVIQRRNNGSVDFWKGWAIYKAGFGDLNGEFWLGNDKISALTNSSNMGLRIDMQRHTNETAYAKYSGFKVNNEADNYRLNVSGYSGTAGDSLAYHNNMPFSTTDRENDIAPAMNCALEYKGAWWYGNCHNSNLNGYYFAYTSYADGIEWMHWTGHYESLKAVEMKVK